MLEILLRGVGGILLIGANAFFVAVEFALTRLRGLDLDPEELEEPGLSRAWALTERLEVHLTACQLGISSTSVLLGVVAEPALTELLLPAAELAGLGPASVRPVSVVVAVVLLNLVHKIWGEQAPTYLGVERPKEVARALAPALGVWSKVMSPVVALGDGLAKGTLGLFGVEVTRSWTGEEEDEPAADPRAGDRPEEEDGGSGGAAPGTGGSRRELVERISGLLARERLPEDRQDEILQAVRIDDIAIREIMVPAASVAWLRSGESFAGFGKRIAAEGHTRYPVLAAGDDRGPGPDPEAILSEEVRGILYVPALFRMDPWPGSDDVVPDGVLSSLLSPGTFLPADTSVADALDRMQEAGEEVALILEDEASEDGEPRRVVGMVTVTDALEVVAGELRDPLDSRGTGVD